MTEKEKTASMTENGVGAEMGDFYKGKVSENLADGQVFQAQNEPVNNPHFDFTVGDAQEPSPDDTTAEVTELPIWGLPPELQNVIEDVTKGYRSYRDFVVASLMCATACIVGKRVTAHYDNYINHATLWLMTVADSSRGKSTPLQFFFKPIQEMEDEAYNRYQEEKQQWRANKCEGEEPIFHRKLMGNATDEVVLKALAKVDDLCWFNDEMRATIESWGLYKNGANGVIVANLMNIFGYSSTSIDRVGYQLRVKHPNLSIVGTTQPSVLKQMMGKKGYDKDGMFQRFLYAFPERRKRPPRTKHIIDDISKSVWNEYVGHLTSQDYGDIYETPEAEQIHDAVLQKWDSQADEYEEHGIIAMGAYVDKLSYHLCRWCACVAVLRGNQRIDADVMRYSIECMEYFKWCAERAFCLIANGEDRPKEPTTAELVKLLAKRYPNMVKAKVAEGLGITRQTFNQFFR